MDPEFDANVEEKNCAQRREDEAGRVKPFACRRREQMSYGPAKDAADDAEHDGPGLDGKVRFRETPRLAELQGRLHQVAAATAPQTFGIEFA
jgi:hypothetical protein